MSGTQQNVGEGGSGGAAPPEIIMHDAQNDPDLNAMTPTALAAAVRQLQQSVEAQKAELERCKQEQRDAQLAGALDNTRLPKTDSGNPLKQWQPKKQSFDDFNTSFKLHMQLNNIPGVKWGMYLLTYLPETAKQEFLKGKEINTDVLSYAAVTRH
jgi:tRNA nucleotidyltransferase/poly(A) polymerase